MLNTFSETQFYLDKETGYQIIRSMCSTALNTILMTDKEFTKMKTTDPSVLLNILKRLMTKCGGHV